MKRVVEGGAKRPIVRRRSFRPGIQAAGGQGISWRASRDCRSIDRASRLTRFHRVPGCFPYHNGPPSPENTGVAESVPSPPTGFAPRGAARTQPVHRVAVMIDVGNGIQSWK